MVRLGYLMSTRPGQGALHLRCRGCTCTGLSAYLRPVAPFPVVETDVRLADEMHFALPGQRNGSLAVTASTMFGVAPNPSGAACIVVVEHRRSSAPRGTASRVRLDSMSYFTKCKHRK